MALWTDRLFLTSDDLLTIDSEVQTVAQLDPDQPIVLDGPNGIIRRATDEAGDELLKFAQQFGGGVYCGSVSTAHYAAVMNTGSQAAVNRIKFLLSQVVVSGFTPEEWSPIKRWVAFFALVNFYRDASNRTLQDRYDTKRQRYQEELHGRIWESVRSKGAPVVNWPIPAPGAHREPNMGHWGESNVSLVAGAGTLDNIPVAVAVSWTDTILPTNGESQTSAPANAILTTGNVLQVSIAGLNPPAGQQPPATLSLGTMTYGMARAWNVYVSVDGGPMVLQAANLPLGTLTYTLPGDPATTGLLAGTGQYPDGYMTLTKTWQRG